MNQPLLSVIVPTFNDGPTIDRCLASLQAQTWGQLEVLVIDDGSEDETPERLASWAQRWSAVRVFRLPQRRGAAAARNVGFQAAQGEILALIDGDMWAPPEWLAFLVAPLLENTADVTGGPDRVPEHAPLVSRCIGYSMDSLLTNAGLRRGDSRLVRYLPGTGNMAIRQSLLTQSGRFDERFYDTGEDKEWLYRVRAAGARFVYLPEALAWHERRPDLWLHARKQLLSGRRRLDIVRQNPQTFEWPHFAPAALVLFLLLGGLIPMWRPWWLACWALGGLVTLLDSVRGARLLGDARAVPLLLFSSACIPLGYGLGICWRAVELAWKGGAARCS